MNHCILEVEVKQAPTLRYTQENRTAIAEMEVQFDALRADDPPCSLRVVGWGNMAEELKNQIQAGQRLVVEGRLRMNTTPRNDGTKEKRAELTLSKFHFPTRSSIDPAKRNDFPNPDLADSISTQTNEKNESTNSNVQGEDPLSWNSAPLVPDTDDIPF